MKKLCLTAALSFIAAGAALADSTRDSVDWDGRYTGVLPCASCPGIQTELTINPAGFYTLKETYLEEKDGTFTSEGEFTWNAEGNQITLKEKDGERVFLVSEGSAWAIGADGKLNEDYQLDKLMEFNGAGQQLYVSPTSIVLDDGKLAFSGILNFEHEAEGGHRSLTADFVIDCAGNKVDMPKVAYFKDVDAGGEKLHEAADNAGNWAPIPADKDDVLNQMAKASCD